MTAALASQFSPRGETIIRSLRSVLHALDEHASQAERSAIYETLISHVRSAMPMAIGAAAVVEPVVAIGDVPLRVDLGGGAFYEIGRNEDGRVSLYLHDALGCDAAAPLARGQAETLVRVLEAAMGVR